MSAPNFSFEHRCIVVTNEDLEYGNYPETERIPQGYTSYPQSLVPTDFRFHNVVMTSGYYEAACIDYETKDGEYKDLLGFSYNYETESKREFYDDLMDEGIKLSFNKFNSLCAGIRREDFEYAWEFTDKLCEVVGEYLSARESFEVDKCLDELMDEYGYEEYVCTARFSNGEAWYEPKAKEGRQALLQAVAV